MYDILVCFIIQRKFENLVNYKNNAPICDYSYTNHYEENQDLKIYHEWTKVKIVKLYNHNKMPLCTRPCSIQTLNSRENSIQRITYFFVWEHPYLRYIYIESMVFGGVGGRVQRDSQIQLVVPSTSLKIYLTGERL